MKSKKILIASIAFITIFIATIIVLSILGNKTRIGYLTDFTLNIDDTLQLNNLDIKNTRELFTIDDKTDEEQLKNFILTNETINEYDYNFRVSYYSKVFRNSDLYDVYPNINKILEENSFIKEIKMNDNGGPFGNIILNKKIDVDKIDNIEYQLKVKVINVAIILVLTFISVIVLYVIFRYVIYHHIKKYINCHFNLNKKDAIFILILLSVDIIIFIFHYWLFFPGDFLYADCWGSMHEGVLGYPRFANWHPMIIGMVLHVLYKLFGYHSYYLLLINLLLWYVGLFLIILSLYIRHKNKLVILLFSISFLANFFFLNVNHVKDITASLIVWFSYSLLFFIITVQLKNKVVNIFFMTLFFLTLFLGMLWRHNFIVTIYPIFVVITYLILKQMKIESKSKYIFNFIICMIIFGILLLGIYKTFPKLILKKVYNIDYIEFASNHIFLLQISGCAVPVNDGSMIPEEWYIEGKDFEDVKSLYNKNPIHADHLTIGWNPDAPFKHAVVLPGIKKVWIKYILKYPINYIKHTINYLANMWTVETWKRTADKIQGKIVPPDIPDDVGILFDGIHFNKFQYKLYELLYKYLPDFNILFFVILSIIIFFVSLYLIIFKNNIVDNILIFSFATSFSSFATALIVSFTPVIIYRYIYPVSVISVVSLISFIDFIYNYMCRKYKLYNNNTDNQLEEIK